MSATPPHAETAAIAALLQAPATVAVVGLSPKPHRDSHQVAAVMQAAGWRIVPVNPAAAGGQILGETVHASLSEATRHARIDLVDVFRNSKDAAAVVDEAIALRLHAVWLQLGVRNEAAAERARAAGLAVVQDRCLKIEWRRLHGV
ncbi:MAG: CoA-binding protein [Rhodoferax sp.]